MNLGEVHDGNENFDRFSDLNLILKGVEIVMLGEQSHGEATVYDTKIKLIKYYKFINYNLIYNNKAINRYKKDNFEISADKTVSLERLRKSINEIKNCSLKNNATNMVFSDGNPKSKIMLIGEAPWSFTNKHYF